MRFDSTFPLPFLFCLGNPIRMSEAATNSFNKWKQSLNHCYDSFVSRKYGDQNIIEKTKALMARVVDEADKLAVQQIGLMSQVSSTSHHQNLAILNVMCAGETCLVDNEKQMYQQKKHPSTNIDEGTFVS